MTCIDHTKRTNPLSARFAAAGFIASAFLVFGAFAVPANAADRRDEHRGGDHRDHRGWNRGYSGGYYVAPPVVYGDPYYAPPPVVYGPAIGISVPGISIGIR
jgi:hypothetical protein